MNFSYINDVDDDEPNPDIKKEFVSYVSNYKNVCRQIDILSETIKDTEHDEEVLQKTHKELKDPMIAMKIYEILSNLKSSNVLVDTRITLMDMIETKKHMIENIHMMTSIDPDQCLLCPVCFERNVSRYLKTCGHTFCVQCVGSLRMTTCPVCRARFDTSSVCSLTFST